MRRHFNAASAVLVALSTIMLSACGPDDGTSANANQSTTAADAAAPPVTQSAAHLPTQSATQSAAQLATQSPSQPVAPGAVPSIPLGASAALSSASDDASDSAVQNVEASLAGDSQQVPPVMHFAPGDSDQNSSRN